MASKYQSFRGKIPAFQLESSYQDKVNDAKRSIIGSDSADGANVAKLAAAFAAANGERKRLEALVSVLNIELEALSQLLVEALESEQQQKVELSSGALVYLQDSPYPQVTDKEALFAWIKKQKMVNLLTAHHQMLKGLCSERLINGEPPPPGVSIFLKTQARVRGANGKDED